MYSLGASFLIGVSIFLYRIAMLNIKEPLVGAAIRLFISFFVCLLALGLGKDNFIKSFSRLNWKGLIAMVSAGLLMGVGSWLIMSAYKYGEVKLATPIIAIYPLFAVILAVLFLGEQLTLQKAIGTIVILCGLVLVVK